MKMYFILLSSGLVVASTAKAQYCKFPQGDKWLVTDATLTDAGGKTLRVIDKLYLDTHPTLITARWEEPAPVAVEDPLAVLSAAQ